jgi:hypothetical protein
MLKYITPAAAVVAVASWGLPQVSAYLERQEVATQLVQITDSYRDAVETAERTRISADQAADHAYFAAVDAAQKTRDAAVASLKKAHPKLYPDTVEPAGSSETAPARASDL